MKSEGETIAMEESRRIMEILVSSRESSSGAIRSRSCDSLEAEWYQIRVKDRDPASRDSKLKIWMKKASVIILNQRNGELNSSSSAPAHFHPTEKISDVDFFSDRWKWPWDEKASRSPKSRSKMKMYAGIGAVGVFAALAIMEEV